MTWNWQRPDWLRWFAETAIGTQRRTMALVAFLLAKTRLLDRTIGRSMTGSRRPCYACCAKRRMASVAA